jgi:hypothetical protein
MSLGIDRADEVVTTTFTSFATAGCIARAGATPPLVDTDPETYDMDPARGGSCSRENEVHNAGTPLRVEG